MDLTERLDQFTEQVNLRYVAAGLFMALGLVAVSAGQLTGGGEVEASGPSDGSGEASLSVDLSIDYGNATESSSVSIANGTSVFHALNSTYPVQYSESEYGYFITSIDGVSGNSSEYWTYTVNGESPEVGAGQYRLEGGENVTFELSRP